jgi:hypothetical protein
MALSYELLCSNGLWGCAGHGSMIVSSSWTYSFLKAARSGPP